MKLESFSRSPSAPCSVPIIQTSSLTLPLHELALFAGAGGGILGGILCGFRTVCAVEHDPYARDVLVSRQNDGCLHPFPIWDDVCTFDGKPWRGLVDVVSGGFPCQDISCAGKGAGIDGERSGLWGEMRRIIGEVRPRFLLVENSPALTLRGGVRVTAELAAMGYVGRNGVLGAVNAGAPHKRERIWFVANGAEHGRGTRRPRGSDPSRARQPKQTLQALADADHSIRRPDDGGMGSSQGENQGEAEGRPLQERVRSAGADGSATGGENLADTNSLRESQPEGCEREQRGRAINCGEGGTPAEWWRTEPDVGRVAHGVAARVDRLRCLGNGQVPAVVRLAWDLLKPKKS